MRKYLGLLDVIFYIMCYVVFSFCSSWWDSFFIWGFGVLAVICGVLAVLSFEPVAFGCCSLICAFFTLCQFASAKKQIKILYGRQCGIAGRGRTVQITPEGATKNQKAACRKRNSVSLEKAYVADSSRFMGCCFLLFVVIIFIVVFVNI